MVEFNLTLIIQILNFFVLVAIIGKFGFGPLMRTLDARKARIAADKLGCDINNCLAASFMEPTSATLTAYFKCCSVMSISLSSD